VEERPQGANFSTAVVGVDRGGATFGFGVVVQAMVGEVVKMTKEIRRHKGREITLVVGLADEGQTGGMMNAEGTEVDRGGDARRDMEGLEVSANNSGACGLPN
jgi:hypothetical protein